MFGKHPLVILEHGVGGGLAPHVLLPQAVVLALEAPHLREGPGLDLRQVPGHPARPNGLLGSKSIIKLLILFYYVCLAKIHLRVWFIPLHGAKKTVKLQKKVPKNLMIMQIQLSRVASGIKSL